MRTYADAYDEMINECYPMVRFGTLTYEPARVLKETDPTAYRGGFAEWTDSLPCAECGCDFSADADEDKEYAPICEACAAAQKEVEA